ncbi:MAG: hypothetical protein J6K62_07645 [Clostridia bacterium]|nr:hypothetical protein [Clostridia bacterium]
MKKVLILLLALTLTLALCGCGEDEKATGATTATSGKPIETTVSTTVTQTEPTEGDGTTITTESTTADPTATDPTGSRTVVTKVTTTATKIPTTIRTLPTKPTTTKAPTTTTKAPTTTTTVAVEQPIDPSGLVQSAEYWGNDYRVDGTSLTFTALMFDGDYCVIIDRQFTSAPEVAEGTTIEYGGKTYYSEGGGMNPLQFTTDGNEIVLGDGGKLALYRDGTVKVIVSNSYLKSGMVFVLPPQ